MKSDGSYYSYSYYKDNIEEDCNFTCVYCDITLSEIGGEGLQLDHFKPINNFNNLKNNPTNLVTACPKCNRLKSDNWPKSPLKFLNPFQTNRVANFKILYDGKIKSNNDSAEYQIQLMSLNRPARVGIRVKRNLKAQISETFDKLHILSNKIFKEIKQLNENELREKIESLENIENLTNRLRKLNL